MVITDILNFFTLILTKIISNPIFFFFMGLFCVLWTISLFKSL